MANIVIKQALTKKDIQWYKETVWEVFSKIPGEEPPESKEEIAKEVTDETLELFTKRHKIHIAYLGKTKIGAFCIKKSRYYGYKQIFSFFVLEKYRGNGYSNIMLDFIKQEYGEKGLSSPILNKITWSITNRVARYWNKQLLRLQEAYFTIPTCNEKTPEKQDLNVSVIVVDYGMILDSFPRFDYDKHSKAWSSFNRDTKQLMFNDKKYKYKR